MQINFNNYLYYTDLNSTVALQKSEDNNEIQTACSEFVADKCLCGVTRRDNVTPIGNRFANAPRNSASLWTTYQLQTGNLKGLGFGLGVYYVGERAGDSDNSYEIPSYVRFDTSIFYRRKNWRAQLNFQNLFNTEYYLGSPNSNRLGVTPGAPFSVVGTLSLQF
ncbi:MAG: TonB-dependent receptor [Rhizonema sp. PD37]|nr:TonB-dependent receptor [Rhizonema sp. PD37]